MKTVDLWLDLRRPKALAGLQAEAEGAGVFAVPTFVVDGELFWGHDRVEFVRAKLRG